MPENPDIDETGRLLSVAEIEREFGVSRQTIHAYRRAGGFPQPVQELGTTRIRFREGAVREFFERNPKQPGRRTDLASRGAAMTVQRYKITTHFSVEVGEGTDPSQLSEALYTAANIACRAAEEAVAERFARYRMVGYDVLADEDRNDHGLDPIASRWRDGNAKS